MTRIFINYRRDDCPAHAGRLADTLEARFGKESVFMDVDAIDLGVDFVERIEQAIGACDVVLALIGDDWLTVTDDRGKRRLDNPDDFVRLEISTALARRDVRVIPVLVEGAEIPAAGDLPDGLCPLARRNGIELTDSRWRSDTSVLIGAIERTLGAPAPQHPPPPEPEPAPQPQPAAAAPTPPAARDEDRFEPRKHLWLAPAFAGLGGLTLIAFGQMAKERRWTIAGVLYLIPFILFWIAAILDVDEKLWNLSLGAWLLTAVGCLVHLVTIRPLYVRKVRQVR